ncbi:2-amino-4-hydroxy-6-hydroxymethyldihydropteridine diphosphokinase [Alginatibacterium sediminis]|uniref:2-amino-4-hydroxy-6-hydroxymethyldihydropteridine diphosphokinase n=1 Tax=Alginatibacterium sediminis TaxID=2164068 RepID=A0A420ECL3_9ALTE|nr:2-amino-4-hydroxy-6-hydroxymethyldihydropteridine diphosphokinase [Alginatibacterium sediminis]RKF18437.1 2-amino-4-hydroxy-6-hydroxymethyldihydropteridine diphosphokinase [Alginatibacterium sediminis]
MIESHLVYLGLGSNINREHYLSQGLATLRQRFGHLDVSPVYESEALGFNGPRFYNFVVELQTDLDLASLLVQLKQIEFDFDRPADAKKKASRTLDIDILFFDNLVCNSPCELPRGEVLKNAFVLKPLFDIAAQFIHPITQHSIAWHWDNYDQQSQALTRVDATFLEETNS